ncbi:MAG: DUF6660 family protein [Chitinophagaceae bacterium]
MKFFFFIMGCFMLYLSCIPCSDSIECNVKTEVKISTVANHQQHSHEKESCTPFCTCSCCAVSVFFVPFTKTPIAKEVFQSVKYPMYLISFTAEAHYSIWQPPQIV